MVAAPGDYKWSSYRATGIGKMMKLWTPHRVYLELGATSEQRALAYRELFRGHIDDSMLRQIRQATNQGMALGNEKFKQDIERLAGRRVTTLKRGPKPKRKEQEEFLL